MNVSRENIDELNFVLKVNIEKADYSDAVAKELKSYRQKASLPGFRPGKVPESLITRKFRIPVMVEEVNKLISKGLSDYMVNEKLQILGEPLPNEAQQKNINWETEENFEFAFDLAVAPEVNLTLSKDDIFNYYKISAAESSIESQIEMAKSQLGKNVPDDEIKDNSSVRGNFVQLDEAGEAIENGIQPEGVLVAVDLIKDADIKTEFIGKKVGDIVIFDPVKALENRNEIKHMLKISQEEANELNSNFSFAVTEILKFESAELNEDLFKQLYGEETEIKTVEDFKNRIKVDIENNLVHSSNHKFAIDTHDKLIEMTNLSLPEAFLKRWLITINKEITLEQIEKEFDDFILDLKWQLIKDYIAKQNNIAVLPEEVNAFSVEMARAQYYQYGIYDIPEEQLESFAKMIQEKPEEKERIYKKIHEDKVIKAVKEEVTIQETPISQEDFDAMMK